MLSRLLKTYFFSIKSVFKKATSTTASSLFLFPIFLIPSWFPDILSRQCYIFLWFLLPESTLSICGGAVFGFRVTVLAAVDRHFKCAYVFHSIAPSDTIITCAIQKTRTFVCFLNIRNEAVIWLLYLLAMAVVGAKIPVSTQSCNSGTNSVSFL